MKAIRGPFDDPPVLFRQRALAPTTVILGSLATIFPFIATFPVLPPAGLMILLAWRLRRPDALAIWAPLPLGLFDDLVSGQPLGSAMLLWSICFFSIDMIERRVMMFRNFWQDWLVAAAGIATCLAIGRLVATRLSAHVDTILLVQIAVSALLYPVAAGLVDWIDSRRGAS